MKHVEANRQLAVVLGMHRSGTSAVTRALEVLGFGLGEHLLPIQDDNPAGFWEDADVVAMNDRLFALVGERWDSLSPELAAEVLARVTTQDRALAADLLGEKLAASERFGLKDPRLSRLLPFWGEVIDALGLDASYVIVLRHPLSVAASLCSRSGMPETQSLLLWLLHTMEAVRTTAGETRVVVDFDRLLQEPSRQVLRMASGLGLSDQVDFAELQRYCGEYLSDRLCHSRFKASDLNDYSGALSPIVDLYTLLARVAADEVSLDDAESVRVLARCEHEARSLFGLLELAAGFATQVRRLEEELADRDRRLDALRSELDQAFVERDTVRTERDALLGSNSWRLTSPLRLAAQGCSGLSERLWGARSGRKS